jgi:hypothetical protein
MLTSELIVGMIMGSIAAFLCLCLLTTSILLYIRRKQASIRQRGIPKWLQHGSDIVSECEKGGVESVGLLEVCEKEWGSEVVEKLPASVVEHARRVEVKTTYAKEGVEDVVLVDVSEKEIESVVVESQWVNPANRVAYMDTLPDGTPVCVRSTEPSFFDLSGDSTLGNFDFDQFLKDPEAVPTYAPSTPKPVRPTLPLSRKSKRSWEVSHPADMNFGSMQVKGIREVREDRPKQGY